MYSGKIDPKRKRKMEISAFEEADQNTFYMCPEYLDDLFDERFVGSVLEDSGYAIETQLCDPTKLRAVIHQSNSALDAGVRSRNPASVVEQLLLDLSVSCSTVSSRTRGFERRASLLRKFYKKLGRSLSTTACKAGSPDAASSTQWPAEYIATQHVRLFIFLCHACIRLRLHLKSFIFVFQNCARWVCRF